MENLPSSMLIEGSVYNGDIWRKIDLMKYIEHAIKLKSQIDAYIKSEQKRRKERRAITAQMGRRMLTLPSMEKPTGLAALSPKKRKAYEEWLVREPQREAQRQQFAHDEDARIEKLQQQYRALELISNRERTQIRTVVNEYEQHLLQHVIPPDYREDQNLRLLLGYLMNNRAHTLTEAINLYHQEKHWKNLEEIAEQQRRDVLEAQRLQEELLREQMQIQAAHMAEMEQMADATRRAAESADFWSMSEYLAVQEYLNR